MTPEAIAKLAKQIAESEWPVDAYGEPASQRCVARLLPILTAHLAAREAEYARLREAAEVVILFLTDEICEQQYPIGRFVHARERLRKALTHQQEQGK